MATKSIKKIQTRCLRITRSTPNPPKASEPPSDPPQSCIDSQESEGNIQFCMQNYQQLKIKPDKQSTSPLNHEAFIALTPFEKEHPLTRSKSNISSRNLSGFDLQNDPLTPEDNNISKPEDIDTLKKLSRFASCQELSSYPDPNPQPTLKKINSKIMELGLSPYSQIRKSYRKLHKRQIISIPYRKCHDALEGRIITIMNKIQHGKNCLKDFESLIDKMGKITTKDLMNRFIVAGIKTIITIALDKNIYDPKIIMKLQQEERNMQARIIQELDSFQEFQVNAHKQKSIDQNQYRNQVIRKLYTVIKQKYPEKSKIEIRRKVLNECQSFFSGEASLALLLKFMRIKLEV